MILNYTTYTLFIFTLNILQCVISFLSSVCCKPPYCLLSPCLRVYMCLNALPGFFEISDCIK
jgi:hypothetical protein